GRPARPCRPRPDLPAADSLALVLVDRLDVELDLHGLADEHAARLERLVPGDPERLAIDLSGRGEADPSLAAEPDRLALVLHVQGDRPRRSADREVAVEAEAPVARGLEA